MTDSKRAFHPVPDLLLVAGLFAVISIVYLLTFKPQTIEATGSRATLPGEMSGLQRDKIPLPASYDSLLAIGHLFYDQANFPMAAEAYSRALVLDSSSLDLRTDFGASLHAMGFAARAMEEFKKVVTQNPTHGVALFNIGILFQLEHQNDSARYYFGRVAESARGSIVGDSAKALLERLPR